MYTTRPPHVRSNINSLHFFSTALENHTEAVGVIEREGTLRIPLLVWSCAFGFAIGESRTLAAFCRSYNSTADGSLSSGSYYQQLTASLAECLRGLIESKVLTAYGAKSQTASLFTSSTRYNSTA